MKQKKFYRNAAIMIASSLVLRFFVFPLFFGAFSVFVSETLPFCETAKMAVAAALYFLFLRIFAFAQSAA